MSINWAEHVYYDESSPTCLRFAKARYSGKGLGKLEHAKDSVAGGRPSDGYYRLSINGVDYSVHIVVYELLQGSIPESFMVDHWDGCRTNNKISNLRIVSAAVSARNKGKRTDNTSEVTGVSQKHKTKCGKVYSGWVAQWCNLDGSRGSKYFSGLTEKSFNLAVNYRRMKIKELNEAGAGYTARHQHD